MLRCLRHVRSAIVLALVLAWTVPPLQTQQAFHLKPNDVVVFYGDSITEQRLYTMFTEAFIVSRYPGLNVRFYNAGWGGDSVNGGGGGPVDERLKRDLLAYKPSVVTIMLGMNDGRYKAFDQTIYDTYTKGYEHIVTTIKQSLPGVRLTLIQPSPFDDVTQPAQFEGGYNGVLLRFGQFVRDLAGRQQVGVADLNTNVVAALQKANAADATEAKRLIPDRVHPGPAAHMLMAAELLKAWNADPIVTDVELDAAALTASKSHKTKLTGLERKGAGLSWSQTDAALPMPVDYSARTAPGALRRNAAGFALAIKSSDFMDALNRQTLKVNGLTGSNYTLKINGTSLGSFSKDKLATGVNLAALPTPMQAQAMALVALTIRRGEIQHMRWRNIQMELRELGIARASAVADNLDALELEVIARQRAAAQPGTYVYELIPEGQ